VKRRSATGLAACDSCDSRCIREYGSTGLQCRRRRRLTHSVAQRCYTLQEWIRSRRPFHTMRDTHIGFAPPLPESPKLSDTIAQAGPTACMRTRPHWYAEV
jgi:hypothetical protein